ncbi:hypothetical protein DSO57_1024062 [Entomophthora muscae]|uniref:Uncharacterized protein n=1 Tax=Entomophthora muscae TaxID=34485 RepID=A0ACC2RTS9_9FUNG|nr:hypothetical protein DSO57_1024062 [Entomophthora muscae]
MTTPSSWSLATIQNTLWGLVNRNPTSPVLVKSSEEAAEVADAVFKNFSVLLTLQTVYKEFLGLRCMIEKWYKELTEAQDILAVLPPFGCTTTCVEISIQKVKIKAILDTVSPVNVVSSKLVMKLKLANATEPMRIQYLELGKTTVQ